MKLIKKLKKEIKKDKHFLTKSTSDGTAKCPHCHITLDYKTFEHPTCRHCGKSFELISFYATVKYKKPK